ncbi:MAG: ankyrin repeat domain-containing protein [Armatimonadetes bacterium]|nr:ankyrin repeat domain-containing protein [Armatimonadota bacterium]
MNRLFLLFVITALMTTGCISPAERNEQLLNAVARGDLQSTKAAIEAGASVNTPTAKGYLPVREAAAKEDTTVLMYLLSQGADVNRNTGDGWTALHSAAQFKRPKSVRILLDSGADPAARNKMGRTPLDCIRGVARLRSSQGNADVAETIRLLEDAENKATYKSGRR